MLGMKNIYSKKKVRREIFNLAWPSIIEQTLIMMVGMVSTIFVGRISKEAMAAVGIINMLIFVFQTVFAGLATGTTVIIARVTGEKDSEKAKEVLVQSLIMSVLVGAAVTVIGYVFAEPILKTFFGSAEQEVFEIAHLFYSIVLIGLPFLVIDMVIAAGVRGAGDTKTPMYVTGIVNVINLVVSSILIFGIALNGKVYIPALGVSGVAIAVNAARISGALIRLYAIYFKAGRLNLTFKEKYNIDIELMKRIMKVGAPAFLEQLVMQGGFLAMQIIIVSMGTISIAAYQVGVNVNSLAFMPIFGFAIAATTMVGQSLGRKDYEDAEIYAKETNRIAVFIISLIGILMFIFAKPLAIMYTRDVQVVDLSISIIRIFAVTEPLIGILSVCAGVLRAAGDIIYIMISSVVGLWALRVVVSLILHRFFGLGIYGVMAGVCLDFGVRAAMYSYRMKLGKWKTLKV
jgi:putative MATE family efflux protein